MVLHHYLLLDRQGSEKGTAKTSNPLVKGFVHDNDDEMKITKVLKNKRGGNPLFREIHMSRLDQLGMTYTPWMSHCQGLTRRVVRSVIMIKPSFMSFKCLQGKKHVEPITPQFLVLTLVVSGKPISFSSIKV